MSATRQGTAEYFKKYNLEPQTLGSTGLLVSPIGFGGYRVHEHDPDHREALKLALASGINLIDTSTNYTDGSSERLIGEVLSDLFRESQLTRENVVVVSKVGYVQGQNLKAAQQRSQNKNPYPDMVEYQADCWHNISPAYLQDQIDQSLHRLKLEKLDVLLLHNPEYFLKTSNSRETYYSRIRKAFEYLETEVERGRIQYYGISSNAFPDAESTAEATSLERVWDIAKSVRKSHHFAVVQMPFNLYESDAAFTINNGKLTALQFAQKNKLGVLLNRPFNAYHRGKLQRLTAFPNYDEVEIKGELHKLIPKVVAHEKKFTGKLPQGLSWGQILRDNMQQLDDILAWKDVLYYQIIPSLDKELARLAPDMQTWGQEYRENVAILLSLVTKSLESLAAARAQTLGTQLDEILPDLKASTTLSQKVLRLYRSLPGVSSVLAGLRQAHYVKDVLELPKPLEASQALDVLSRFRRS